MKKIVILSFIFSAMVLTLIPFVVSAQNKNAFPDVSEENPFLEAISALKTKSVIQGYGDGKYLPDSTINRAEFLKIVIAATMPNPQGENCFSDVKNDWYAKYICSAKKQGVVQGYLDGTFKPDQNINFAEASKILTKAFKITPSASMKNDVWFKRYAEALQQKKAIPVSIDYPEKKLTRGEMAEIAWRLEENIQTKSSKSFSALMSPLPRIESCAELKEKFSLQNYRNTRFRYMIKTAMPMTEGAMEDDALTERSTAETSAETSGAGTDYSKTNVQVEGVDEADIIKNDGKYIYLVKGNTIRIVEAFPASSIKELTKIQFAKEEKFYPNELYVDGNRLVILGRSYDEKSRTNVYVFDITDRNNVKQLRKVSFEGNYISSRRIDDHVYVIINQFPDIYRILKQNGEPVPTYFDSAHGKEEKLVTCGSVRFFPRYDEPNYLIVASVPTTGGTEKIEKQVYLGAGNTVYASLKNLYVATNKYQHNEFKQYDIWIPPITSVSTAFYRFELDNGEVRFKGIGEVPGTLLNQFSMDEEGATFRVATTKGEVWGSEKSSNNLYILDRDNLQNILGRIENIAPGERIKSVRFMGKRAYLVTFKTIDPLFVIDVSEPTAPKILGELKIPGYSDYLHPYDENHLIGFGKEVDETIDADKVHSEDAVYYTAVLGMKIALFDVSDTAHPKELYKVVIGDRGTESELLRNHKTLLFSKSKNLIAFPIVVMQAKGDPKNPETQSEVVFRGAYVYGLDLDKGFELKSKITHYDSISEQEKQQYFYEGGVNSAMIQRMLYIGDSLYSVSMAQVQANSLADWSKEGEAVLEKESEEVYPVEPVY